MRLLPLRFLSPVLILAFSAPAAADPITFVEVSQAAGIEYVGRSWGSMWADYNGDGHPDVWMPNHQNGPALFVNQGNGTFIDVAPTVMDSVYQMNYDKHGAAWADFDNDGDQDIYQLADEGAGGQIPNWFFVNNNGLLTENAVAMGLDYVLGRGRMPLWVDYDHDGLPDVFHPVHRRGDGLDGPSTIFHQSSPGVFVDAAAATGYVAPSGLTNFVLLGDVTGDGRPELLTQQGKIPHAVYEMSNVPWVDIRASTGIPNSCCAIDGLIADLDGDLDNDIFVVRGEKWQAFVQTDSNVVEAHLQGSNGLQPFGMETGISFQTTGDILIDPYPFWELDQVFIGQFGYHPSLFPVGLSSADSSNFGTFPHVANVDVGLYIGYDPGTQTWEILRSVEVANLVITSTAAITNVQPINWDPATPAEYDAFVRNLGTSWIRDTTGPWIANPSEGRNVVAGDFDNDMDLDLYVVATGPTQNIPNILYENQGGGIFVKLAGAGGAEGDTLGRGDAVTTCDYDGNGFLDLLVTNGVSKSPFELDGPTYLFQNQGNGNHWLELDLVGGPLSSRDAVGARVVATAGGVSQVREQNGGIHYRGQNHQRIHFGLGSNTMVETVVITWPSGDVQVLTDVAADQILTVSEVQSTDAPVVAEAPATGRLSAFPNPFGTSTTIVFSLPQPQSVRLTVHDVTGRAVGRLLDGELAAGPHQLEWAGRDGAGRRVSAGVYFLRLETGGERQVRKIVLLESPGSR